MSLEEAQDDIESLRSQLYDLESEINRIRGIGESVDLLRWCIAALTDLLEEQDTEIPLDREDAIQRLNQLTPWFDNF